MWLRVKRGKKEAGFRRNAFHSKGKTVLGVVSRSSPSGDLHPRPPSVPDLHSWGATPQECRSANGGFPSKRQRLRASLYTGTDRFFLVSSLEKGFPRGFPPQDAFRQGMAGSLSGSRAVCPADYVRIRRLTVPSFTRLWPATKRGPVRRAR